MNFGLQVFVQILEVVCVSGLDTHVDVREARLSKRRQRFIAHFVRPTRNLPAQTLMQSAPDGFCGDVMRPVEGTPSTPEEVIILPEYDAHAALV